MKGTSPMGVRQPAYEKREAVWARAKELLSDRVFTGGTDRTEAEIELALFLIGK